MTTKTRFEFDEKLLNYLDYLIEQCLINELDALFIIGNLFNNPTPKNQFVDIVKQKLIQLTEAGIQVFIMPGPCDTPLVHEYDTIIHYLFNFIPDVYIIAPSSDIQSRTAITAPFINGKITYHKNGEPASRDIEIFSPTTSLITPQELEFKFKANPDKISMLTLYGSLLSQSTSNNEENRYIITPEILKRINECKINVLLVGGLNLFPTEELMSSLNYDLVICPPAIPYDFNYSQHPTGIKIENLEKIGDPSCNQFIYFTGYKIIQKIITVNGKNPDEINNIALNLIQAHSDTNGGYFQLKLDGTMMREHYQMLNIYEIIEKGKKNNKYFELSDEIQFSDKNIMIKDGLSPLRFIKELIQIKIDNNALTQEEKSLLHQTLIKIDKDWKELQ